MAVNATTFSGKQFAVYLASETTTGTFNNNDANWHRIDVEGVTLPTFSPVQEFEMRSGSGRIAEFGQVFASTKRVVTEFTLSGRLTQSMWVALAENVIGDEFDGGTGTDSVLTLTNSYNGLTFKVGTDPSSATDFAYLMSVYFEAPTAADSWSLKSCICTNLSITADMDSAAGRFDYTATFQTQSAPSKGAVTSSDAAAIGSTYVYLSEIDERVLDIMNYDGSTDSAGITPLFKTFNLTIDAPCQFLGASGTNAEPEVWAKALPELGITWGGTVKYDAETDLLIEAFRDAGSATALSYLTLYMADVPVDGSAATPTNEFFNTASGGSATKFGMWFAKSKLTSCEVTSDDVAMVNFEAKVLSAASGNSVHLLGGDNA